MLTYLRLRNDEDWYEARQKFMERQFLTAIHDKDPDLITKPDVIIEGEAYLEALRDGNEDEKQPLSARMLSEKERERVAAARRLAFLKQMRARRDREQG